MLTSVDEIPALGPTAAPDHWRQWTEEPGYAHGWRSVRRHFQIGSFGANAKEAAAGELLVVPHREADHENHGELYFVFAGSARFELDGESVEVVAGDLLHIAPGPHRQAHALETPTKVLILGGTPGVAYAAD